MAKSAGLGSETILKAAIEGLEAQKGRVEQQILEVRRQLGLGSGRRGRPPGTKNAPAEGKRPRKRHKISKEGRERIAAAARARWAALRKAKGTAPGAPSKKRGRK